MSKAKHIGVFGRQNSGKSSLINIISGQKVAIVSDIPGTTTDPVKKRMEITGIGPVVLIDTAGIDDQGDLGLQRVAKTKEIVSQIDLAILLFTNNEIGKFELDLISSFNQEEVPFIIVHNQSDIISLDSGVALELGEKFKTNIVEFSCSLLDQDEQNKMVTTLILLMEKSLIGVLSAYPLPAIYPAYYIIMPRYFRMQKTICSTPHAYPKTLDDLSRFVPTI